MGFPIEGLSDKESAYSAGDAGDPGSILGSGRSPGGGHGHSLVFLPWKSHGQKSLAGFSPWGCERVQPN